jgi:hypothetical protein
MGNCCNPGPQYIPCDYVGSPSPLPRRKSTFKPHPFVEESSEPFSLVYYDRLRYSGPKLGVRSQNLCECNKLEEHLKMRCVYTMPGHACDLLVLVDGTLFRINNPGTYYCHKCGEMRWARLFANAAVYKLYYESKFIWSAIPSKVEGSASCVQFNIIKVRNFGYILRPLNYWKINFIIHLPDVTVILPKPATNGPPKSATSVPPNSAPFGKASKDSSHTRTLHYVVNTLEAGAVGIFNKEYSVKAPLYSEYIAINENGKLIKM